MTTGWLRLTLPSSNRRCGFPASGTPESSRLRHARAPIRTGEPAHQPRPLEMPVPRFSFRRVIGPLTAPFKMLDQTAAYEPVDLPVHAGGIPFGAREK